MGQDRKLPVSAYLSQPGDPRVERPKLWRDPEDIDGNKQAGQPGEADFPEPLGPDVIDRRSLLNFMSASLALGGLAGCAANRQPWGAPLLSQPRLSPQHTPGVPLVFATSMQLDGLGRGVLVKTHDGRPVKIEGNPLHPASLGATDAFAQAEVLSLYDPDRSNTPMAGGIRRSWAEVGHFFARVRQQFQPNNGRGLHILLEPCASPTRERLIGRVRQAYPEASWYRYSPLADDQARGAAVSIFGRPADEMFDLKQADVILTFGGDLLGAGACHVRHAADYAERRRASDRPLPRLYSIEASPSLTGARADRRLAVGPRTAEAVARQMLELVRKGEVLPDDSQDFATAVAGELKRAGQRALVIAGREQTSIVQAIVHAINAEMGAVGTTVRYIEPVRPASTGSMESLRALAQAMAGGSVEALLVLGGNPAYDAPGDLDFAALSGRVPTSLHLGYYRDETSLACRWHLPARHALESWGDLCAFDGTAGLCQPATVPLVEAITPEEVLALLAGEPADGHAHVQATWREAWRKEFEERWASSLEAGVIADSAAREVAVKVPAGWSPGPAEVTPVVSSQTIIFAPDQSVWDGRFANNVWLQELPKPLTKQVWGNAALISPETAVAYGLRTGDIALFSHDGRSLEAPVLLLPGQAPTAVTLSLGYGRAAGARNASARGFDANRLRSSQEPWVIEGVTMVPMGSREELITTQRHHTMEGRDIVRIVQATMPVTEPEPPRLSIYPEYIYDGVAWGMAIDLDLCLGCNACIVACQAENNVPVVGPEQVALGREMHWLRVDRYFAGPPADPEIYFQPVPCMHCERAPCEVVCPVNATVHSSEGLNQMVYSRCVGTRTCSNNCPYKVRRFNWHNYNQKDPFAAPDEVQNPDVTARWRGVIEKCTYCVQRIRAARITANIENRSIADGEVITACQQACPTRAIVFGNINDPDSIVRRRKADRRNYALLGELNTLPRTTYLARISDFSSLRTAGGRDDDSG